MEPLASTPADMKDSPLADHEETVAPAASTEANSSPRAKEEAGAVAVAEAQAAPEAEAQAPRAAEAQVAEETEAQALAAEAQALVAEAEPHAVAAAAEVQALADSKAEAQAAAEAKTHAATEVEAQAAAGAEAQMAAEAEAQANSKTEAQVAAEAQAHAASEAEAQANSKTEAQAAAEAEAQANAEAEAQAASEAEARANAEAEAQAAAEAEARATAEAKAQAAAAAAEQAATAMAAAEIADTGEVPLDVGDPPSMPVPTPSGVAAAAESPPSTSVPTPTSTAAPPPADPDDRVAHDIVLRPPAPPTASGDSRLSTPSTLASHVEILESASGIDQLQALLAHESVRAVSGAHADSVARCLQYVSGLAKPEEVVLAGWPVLSINEWGQQQVRTLVLTSHALYRVAFHPKKGAIDHYSRTSLGACRRIERGRYAFKLHLTEPDGRENPFGYFWSAYVKKGKDGASYARFYYPIHPEAIPIELAMAVIIRAIATANRILCEKVRCERWTRSLSLSRARARACIRRAWLCARALLPRAAWTYAHVARNSPYCFADWFVRLHREA